MTSVDVSLYTQLALYGMCAMGPLFNKVIQFIVILFSCKQPFKQHTSPEDLNAASISVKMFCKTMLASMPMNYLGGARYTYWQISILLAVSVKWWFYWCWLWIYEWWRREPFAISRAHNVALNKRLSKQERAVCISDALLIRDPDSRLLGSRSCDIDRC